MDAIQIINIERQETGWQFAIDVGGRDAPDVSETFNVTLDDDTFERLVGDSDADEEDVMTSFMQRLISNQPVESLPANFDVDSMLNRLVGLEDSVRDSL